MLSPFAILRQGDNVLWKATDQVCSHQMPSVSTETCVVSILGIIAVVIAAFTAIVCMIAWLFVSKYDKESAKLVFKAPDAKNYRERNLESCSSEDTLSSGIVNVESSKALGLVYRQSFHYVDELSCYSDASSD
ncbi:hypothetical protein AAVH_04133 [Aphelenchoides avenae]|nr:hypothetical protein AAVH_04133 [Aphelenchus avenae]